MRIGTDFRQTGGECHNRGDYFGPRLDYRLESGRNSGILLRIPESGNSSAGGFLKVKLLDDEFANHRQLPKMVEKRLNVEMCEFCRSLRRIRQPELLVNYVST